MNVEKFKSWFEGFSEGLKLTGQKMPTEDQWLMVLEKIKQLKETPYVPTYRTGDDLGRYTYRSPSTWPLPEPVMAISGVYGNSHDASPSD